jgi:hypothetical protein
LQHQPTSKASIKVIVVSWLAAYSGTVVKLGAFGADLIKHSKGKFRAYSSKGISLLSAQTHQCLNTSLI